MRHVSLDMSVSDFMQQVDTGGCGHNIQAAMHLIHSDIMSVMSCRDPEELVTSPLQEVRIWYGSAEF